MVNIDIDNIKSVNITPCVPAIKTTRNNNEANIRDTIITVDDLLSIIKSYIMGSDPIEFDIHGNIVRNSSRRRGESGSIYGTSRLYAELDRHTYIDEMLYEIACWFRDNFGTFTTLRVVLNEIKRGTFRMNNRLISDVARYLFIKYNLSGFIYDWGEYDYDHLFKIQRYDGGVKEGIGLRRVIRPYTRGTASMGLFCIIYYVEEFMDGDEIIRLTTGNVYVNEPAMINSQLFQPEFMYNSITSALTDVCFSKYEDKVNNLGYDIINGFLEGDKELVDIFHKTDGPYG